MFVRFAVPRTLAALVLTSALMAAPAAAQDAVPAPTFRDAADAAAAELAQLAVQPPAPIASRSQQDRPAALMPLYASFIALQGMDVHSTTRGLSRGAVEANPFMKDIAGNPGALIAVKAASTAGIIFGVEKLRKKNRTAAIAVMLALNAGTAYVVQHNYRVAQRQGY
jgi:hypothetical protein